jgi:YVTN family beta-propeller protein
MPKVQRQQVSKSHRVPAETKTAEAPARKTREHHSGFGPARADTKRLDPDAPRKLTLNKHELGEAILAAKKPGVIDAPGLPKLPPQSGKLLVVNKGVSPGWDAHGDDPKLQGNKSSLMVMDLKTGEMTKKLPLHDQSHEIALGPDGHTAVIPHFVWKVPEHGRQAGSQVTVLDLKTDTQLHVDLPGYTGAHGLEWIDEDHVAVTVDAHAPTTEKSFILEINVRTGKLDRAVPTEQEESHLVRLSKDKKTYFVTDLEGTFTAIDRESGKVKKALKTGGGTEGFDLSPDGKEIWVAARDDDKITVFDAQTLEKKHRIKSEGGPIRVLFMPDGKHALITNRDANAVGVIDAKTGVEVKRIDLKVPRLVTGAPQVKTPSGAMMIQLGSPESHTAFIANSHSGVVTAFDTKTWELSGFLKAGTGPDPLAFVP